MSLITTATLSPAQAVFAASCTWNRIYLVGISSMAFYFTTNTNLKRHYIMWRYKWLSLWMFRYERRQVTGRWEELYDHNKAILNLCSSQNIKLTESRRTRWVTSTTHIWEIWGKGSHALSENFKKGRLSCRWQDDIKIDLGIEIKNMRYLQNKIGTTVRYFYHKRKVEKVILWKYSNNRGKIILVQLNMIYMKSNQHS
jgi:hypothetical protein